MSKHVSISPALNKYAATMHLLRRSTILTSSSDRATGDYADTYVKQDGAWLYAERRLYVDRIEERSLS
jgi:hypothetical protein